VRDLPNDPTSLRRNRFEVDGAVVTVDSTIESPKLAVLSGLLSPSDCDALIAEAGALVAPSLVIDEHNVGSTSHDTRTSSGAHFLPGTSALADAIQRRIMSVIGLPMDRAEPLQVQHYVPGQEYAPHFDYFDTTTDQDADPAAGSSPGPVSTTVSRFGQRVATMICYLSAVDAGGATVFPAVGLEVRPRPGRAVYFTYLDADGAVDPMSLHAGAPVDEGEKWIVTQWCRERPYRAAEIASWAPPVPPGQERP
jgi:prolyl 4-hydroxylase